MRRTWPLVLAVAVVLVGGCAKRAPESARGTWALDTEATARAASEVLAKAGRIPPGSEEAARQAFAQVQFDLELAADGTFTARQGLRPLVKRYRGTWSVTRGRLALEQTHEEEEPASDRMTGTVDGAVLRLEHQEQGLAMPYVLARSAAAAPR